MTMTIRSLSAALALTALAPFAAHADAPSGEFFTVFANEPAAVQPAPSSRGEHRNYVEFTLDELIRSAARATVTLEEVRRSLATMPTPPVGA
jgi:ABC-type oligopeptide transport system substrate-binding subunit